MMDGDTGANVTIAHRRVATGLQIHHTGNTAATRAEESGDQISQVLSAEHRLSPRCVTTLSRGDGVMCDIVSWQWVVYLHTVPVSPPYCILPHSSFHSDVTCRETQSEGLVLVGHPVLTSTPFHHSTHQLNTAHTLHSQPQPSSACSRLNPVFQRREKQNIC